MTEGEVLRANIAPPSTPLAGKFPSKPLKCISNTRLNLNYGLTQGRLYSSYKCRLFRSGWILDLGECLSRPSPNDGTALVFIVLYFSNR